MRKVTAIQTAGQKMRKDSARQAFDLWQRPEPRPAPAVRSLSKGNRGIAFQPSVFRKLCPLYWGCRFAGYGNKRSSQ